MEKISNLLITCSQLLTVRYKQFFSYYSDMKISQLCCSIRVAKKLLALVSQMVIISEPLFEVLTQ
jgi:hypothetical protein